MAFVISTLRVKDPEKLKQYAAATGPTIAAHGGELLLRGAFHKSLTGVGEPHMAGIIRFPDMAALEHWYDSKEYQALIPLRDEACDMTLLAYAPPE